MMLPQIHASGEKHSTFQRPTGVVIALLIVCGLIAILAMDRSLADPDLWGHVQFGRDLLNDGLAKTNQYSFTAEGYPWINHENLSEVILAVTYDTFGNSGLIYGKRCLSLILIGMIAWATVRRGCSWIALAMGLVLIAISMRTHWVFRPQLASFMGLACLLLLLDNTFRTWNPHNIKLTLRGLFPAPILMLVWCNSHGGFVAGVAILTVLLLSRGIQAFTWRHANHPDYRRTILILLTAIAGSYLATLCNPYGLSLHTWLVRSLGTPRPEIADWNPVRLDLWHGRAFLVAVVVSVIVMGVRSKSAAWRKVQWPRMLVLVLVAWQASQHMRHVALFMIVFGMWVIPEIRWSFARTQYQASRPVVVAAFIFIATCTALASAAMVRLWQDGKVILVSNVQYPVDAFAFIHDQQLSGRMVVAFNWAQYVIGAFGGNDPRCPLCLVSFDGRFRTCYPQSIVDMNLDFQLGDLAPAKRHRDPSSGPFNASAAIRFEDPSLVLLDRRQQPSVRVMEEQTDHWALLYQDAISQVWGLRKLFDQAEGSRYLPIEERQISDQITITRTPWPAFPDSSLHNSGGS